MAIKVHFLETAKGERIYINPNVPSEYTKSYSNKKYTVEIYRNNQDNLLNAFEKSVDKLEVGDRLNLKNGLYIVITDIQEFPDNTYKVDGRYGYNYSAQLMDENGNKLSRVERFFTSYNMTPHRKEFLPFLNFGVKFKDSKTLDGATWYVYNAAAVNPNGDIYEYYNIGVVNDTQMVSADFRTGISGGSGEIDISVPFDSTLNLFHALAKLMLEDYVGEDIGETSGTGGQNGSFDDSSDNIPVPSLPTVSACSCGMITMYDVTVQEIKDLADFLWSDISEIDEHLRKLFNDPMDGIISLSLMPIAPTSLSSETINIGGVAIDGVTGQRLISQYAQLDCGSVNVNAYYGNALDYNPYTKCAIYLPFIGTQTLNIDDVVGRDIGVIYNIDVLTGACTAFVTCSGSVFYSFTGTIGSQIPISGKNASEIFGAVASIGITAGLAVASGGASVSAVAAESASGINGRMAASLVQSGLSVMGAKADIQRGGATTSTHGLLGVKYPVITLIRPRQSLPVNFHAFKGYPSNITAILGNLSGYTEIQYMHVDTIPCTLEEKQLIQTTLEQGIII